MIALNRSLRLLPGAIAFALGVPSVEAATITVTSGGDSGSQTTCTLRQAFDAANSDSAGGSSCTAGSGDDTIVFASGLVNSTITLAGGSLDIASGITLIGSGQTIDGNDATRVFDVQNSYDVSLSNLTITRGNAEYGAGLFVHSGNGDKANRLQSHGKRTPPVANGTAADYATTTLSNVKVTNNHASRGGAGLEFDLFSAGVINQSTISGNTVAATNNYAAGGIYVAEAYKVTISNSVISGNSVTGSSDYVSGAIYDYGSPVIANNVTFANNSAAGGVQVAGAILQASNKYVALNDCTLSGNSATGTSAAGAAIVGYSGRAGDLRASNTIITGNTGATPNVLVQGTATFTPAGSLLGAELQETYSGSGNKFGASAGLGPLADNGGATQTMALLAGSPAINAGNNALIPGGLTTDQRGAGFPRVIGAIVDIGAFESQTAAAAVPVVPLPTLSAWVAACLAGLLALFGAAVSRRRFDR